MEPNDQHIDATASTHRQIWRMLMISVEVKKELNRSSDSGPPYSTRSSGTVNMMRSLAYHYGRSLNQVVFFDQ
jgi:hypothetical protein